MVTGSVYRKFGKIWTCGFEICERRDIQTEKQTEAMIDLKCIHGRSGTGGWVCMCVCVCACVPLSVTSRCMSCLTCSDQRVTATRRL